MPVRIMCSISFSDDEPGRGYDKDGFDDHYRVKKSYGDSQEYLDGGSQADDYNEEEDEVGRWTTWPLSSVVARSMAPTTCLWRARSSVFARVVDRIIYYYQYDYITMLDENSAKNMTFPAITVCNYNFVRKSQMSYSDLIFMGPLLGFEEGMAPGFPLAPEPDRPPGSRFSLDEFYNRTRHRIEDILLECNFRGIDCGPESFRESLPNSSHLSANPSSVSFHCNHTGTDVQSAHKPSSKMCQCTSSGSKPRPGSLAEAGKLFLKHTTLHGLRHIFLSGSYPRRVAWLLAFLAALGLLLTWSSNRVRYLLSSPVYSKAHMVYAKRLVFPAVTICNQNLLLPRRMKKTDIFSAGRWLGLFVPAVHEAAAGPAGAPAGGDAAVLPLPGELCGPRNFSTIFTRYGKCYTFNSGQDGRPLMVTMKGGMGNGLELMLDIQQDEYLPVWGETDETSFEAGIKVQIHTQDEPPFIDQLGFGVAPGFQTFVSCQEQRLTYLPPPWGDCKASAMDSDFFNTYSITACRIDCETRYLVENCNCRMVHMPGDAPYCTPEQYKDCADPALDFLVERDNDYCVCETPCNMTRFGKEMSFVKIPSKASAKYLAKKFQQDRAVHIVSHILFDNLLVLDIYFEALNYETIEQKKAYELAGLLGDIGGQMGLFIGASLLTILELFDYLYEVIKYKLCRCVKKKHKGRNNNDRGAVLSLDDVKHHVSVLLIPCLYRRRHSERMAARGGFQSAPTGGVVGAMGPGPPVQGAGPGMGPGTPTGRMVPSSAQQNHMYRSPMPGPGYPRPGMPPSNRMTPQGPAMGPPGYGNSPVSRPVMPGVMDPSRKRPAPQQIQQVQQQNRNQHTKKKKMADKILPQRIRELVPESQAYMDLLAFERKLDQTIMRKRLDIQEALKRPIKQKRKLRIFISNTFNPAKPDAEDGEGTVASWELRVEGRLLEDSAVSKYEATKQKRKFSSFFKSLVIELDKDLYGPDITWWRTATTQETDGFQVKRPGDVGVRCTVLLMLDYQPPQFKLDPRLARMLGIHTQTRPVIIQALWQYVKTHKLQDPHEREFINCDKYLQQIFETQRMKFSEIPQRLHALLMPPEPIIINHVISVDPNDQKKTACYDIDVEVDDTLKTQMNSFLLSTASQQEIAGLDNKIHETIETINQLKTQREFMLSFARDPQGFINDWLQSQCRDLKTMTDVVGNPEEERRADFYYQPWAQEAVCRYFYSKVQQRRQELETALGIRNT
ncbi:hypothetical protein F7725_017333 [Dissostichus mawsoni]|uniref:DM2 domain-containing protein n=1 Tax=Dissostichus mawsoni TaxID=36200 RepID=A0A7J5Z4U1_DISMA|nr:hypothetical protein F7725_017333 [Dissostichus mawsoni]